MMAESRSQVPWSDRVWERIDKMVRYEEEILQTAVKFLPTVGPLPDALTVDSDKPIETKPALFINEAATFPLIETWVEFALTPQQVVREETSMAACILAGRAANLLVQAQDLILFQGDRALQTDPIFENELVLFRSGPAGGGLLGALNSPAVDPQQRMEVPSLCDGVPLYAQETYDAVARGMAWLKSREHYGPYVLILETEPYADAFAPLAVTLDSPAGRIQEMVQAGLFGTGSLPGRKGLLISLGGNTVDVVIGRHATTSFMQQDARGKYCFRVWNRFALRVKDPSAFVEFTFLGPEQNGN